MAKMPLKESFQNLFKPKEVKEAERVARFENAIRQEKQAAVAYLTGDISLEQYHQLLETTYPITKINLRELASELRER